MSGRDETRDEAPFERRPEETGVPDSGWPSPSGGPTDHRHYRGPLGDGVTDYTPHGPKGDPEKDDEDDGGLIGPDVGYREELL